MIYNFLSLKLEETVAKDVDVTVQSANSVETETEGSSGEIESDIYDVTEEAVDNFHTPLRYNLRPQA